MSMPAVVVEGREDLAERDGSFVRLAAKAVTCHFQSPYLSPTCHFNTPISPNVYRPPVTLLPPFTPGSLSSQHRPRPRSRRRPGRPVRTNPNQSEAWCPTTRHTV